MPDTAFPVVVFDLDGTLLRGTTVSLLLAQWLGREDEISELERAFRAHEISNSVVADTSAGWLTGRNIDEAWRVLMDGPWIDGMTETLQTLNAARVSLLLGTITWSFAGEMLRQHHDFAAVSGTEMQAMTEFSPEWSAATSTSTTSCASSRTGAHRMDTR